MLQPCSALEEHAVCSVRLVHTVKQNSGLFLLHFTFSTLTTVSVHRLVCVSCSQCVEEAPPPAEAAPRHRRSPLAASAPRTFSSDFKFFSANISVSLLFVDEPMVSQRGSQQRRETTRPSPQAVGARGDNYCLEASEERVAPSKSSLLPLPLPLVLSSSLFALFSSGG